jgi:hypothetical protein
MVTMNAFLQQQATDLRQRIGAHLARRAELEGSRASASASSAAAERIRALDAELIEHGRALADAERKLMRDGR